MLGVWMAPQPDGNIFVARSLERPWDKNINNVSCIPAGSYRCEWTKSTRLSLIAGHDVFTYEVLNVSGRAGIRIHSANYYSQLAGCIAMGSALKDINADAQLDAIHSGDTVKEFAIMMGYKPFMLDVLPIKTA